MADNADKPNILNNAIIVLAILFTVPAALVIGATWVTASYGRIPGGTSTDCERTLDDATIYVELYRYQAGLTPYETQTFYMRDAVGTDTEFFKVDIQAPEDFNCDENIRQVDESILITTQKGIAISPDDGATWYTHTVCDPPRPTDNRCDKDPLNFTDITFDDSQNGRLVVQEAITDEYGVVVLNESGDPQILNQYILVTDDGGETWNLAND